MAQNTNRTLGLIGLLVGAALAGCSGHYHITEPQSGRAYLTRSYDQSGVNGATQFKDAVTGAKVSLASSEIQKVGNDEYAELLRHLKAERDGDSDEKGE